MQCPACGAEVALASGERVGFRDACEACHADLHVCCACVHHDVSAYNECREPNAERVDDRARANRCEYFRPGTPARSRPAAARDGSRAALDALFKK